MNLATVSTLINDLTSDEDKRQQLWVYYLEGNDLKSFSQELEEYAKPSLEEEQFRHALYQLVQNPLSERFQALLEYFSDFERSILFHMMLGLSPMQISQYKGISEVRIRQAIATLRYNTSWEKVYGIKEEPNRRRKIWAKRRRD